MSPTPAVAACREPRASPSPRRGASPDASLLPIAASSSQPEGRSAASCARTSTAAGSVSSVQPRPTAPAGPAANLVPSPRWAAASALPKPPAASSSTPQSSAPSEAAKAMSPKVKEEDLDSADRSDSGGASGPGFRTAAWEKGCPCLVAGPGPGCRTVGMGKGMPLPRRKAIQEQTTASSSQVGERGRPRHVVLTLRRRTGPAPGRSSVDDLQPGTSASPESIGQTTHRKSTEAQNPPGRQATESRQG